jgi:PIN domain nuclease of toxin-antitoxin system
MAIEDTGNAIFLSAASAWEIATKIRLGKLPRAAAVAPDMASVIVAQGFLPLPVSFAHGQTAGALRGSHKDPFDRMLMAQAMLDNMVLVSNQQHSGLYGVRRLW